MLSIIYYRLFLINASSRNGIRKKIWQELGCCYFLFKQKIVKCCVQCYVLASHCQAGTVMVTLQSTLRTVTDSCKNAALQCYLVATVIYIQSVRSHVCVCVCVCVYIYRHTHIQGVPGGRDKTLGECSLC